MLNGTLLRFYSDILRGDTPFYKQNAWRIGSTSSTNLVVPAKEAGHLNANAH